MFSWKKSRAYTYITEPAGEGQKLLYNTQTYSALGFYLRNALKFYRQSGNQVLLIAYSRVIFKIAL